MESVLTTGLQRYDRVFAADSKLGSAELWGASQSMTTVWGCCLSLSLSFYLIWFY